MSQITKTTASQFVPALMAGFQYTSNNIGAYLKNCVTKAPGLGIKGGGSPTVASANTVGVRCTDVLSILSAGDMPNLNTATYPDGTIAGNLASDDGTVPPSTKSCRMYTFLVSVNPLTAATTKTVVCGYDFTKHGPANVLRDVNLGDGSKAIIGFLYVKNETGADFQPGTTALDVGSLTASYGDAFGYMPYNATF
jgi:hypothetical protein